MQTNTNIFGRLLGLNNDSAEATYFLHIRKQFYIEMTRSSISAFEAELEKLKQQTLQVWGQC